MPLPCMLQTPKALCTHGETSDDDDANTLMPCTQQLARHSLAPGPEACLWALLLFMKGVGPKRQQGRVHGSPGDERGRTPGPRTAASIASSWSSRLGRGTFLRCARHSVSAFPALFWPFRCKCLEQVEFVVPRAYTV